MKCTHCGAETEDQRFCIYCGQPLQKTESGVHAKKASRKISGVMRMRRHAAVSQSSLPEVLQERGRLDLSAMDSDPSHDAVKTSDTEVKATMNDQSRELESLLLKLNEKHNSATDISETDLSEENLLDDSVETQVETETDVKTEVSEKEETHTSGPIPVGSGSFARVPSGGFHPIVETVKSACLGMVKRLKTIPSKFHFTSRKTDASASSEENAKVSPSSEENKKISDESLQIEKERKKFIISSVVAAIAVIALLIIIVKHDREETDYSAVAAQTMGDNDYAFNGMDENNQDITTLTFDDGNFVVPNIFDEGGENAVKEPAAQAPVPAQPSAMPQQVAQNQPVPAVVPQNPGKSRLTEPRTYGSKDNVLAVPAEGQSFRTNKQCLMREGPASRFGLVKSIPQGTNIKILTKTEEDWLLNGNVWTKEGYPAKLGPGSQFENAVKGAGVPQAKSRVISASNWRYVQVGDTYGYVGPVCFK